MEYCLKLTDNAIAQIRMKTGITKGNLNFNTGVLRVSSKKDIEAVAERYDIDNVNNVPYAEYYASMKAEEKAERNIVIGKKIQIGSIVRVKYEEAVYHIVIVNVDGDLYEGAKIVLDSEDYNPECEVLLTKGKDVIYRNLTYKNKVRVLNDTISGVQDSNFIKGIAGKIIGKVVDYNVMNDIINLVKCGKNEPETGEHRENVSEEEMSAENGFKGDEHGENASEKGKATEDVHEECKEPETVESIVKKAKNYEELIASLKLPDTLLKEGVSICIKTGRSGLKKLIPMLQQEPSAQKLSQNAIKNLITQEFTHWCESENVTMNEYTVNYFLKVIVKGFKNT